VGCIDSFDEYSTISVEEVKNTLKNMSFEEHSLYALGATNQKTVAVLLEEIEDKLKSENEEYVKQILLINKFLIETFLEKGIIIVSDGPLDAF